MGDLIRGNAIRAEGDTEMLSLEAFLAGNNKAQAVWLDADEEVESIADYLSEISAVGLNFPAFSDGRPYSGAAILRRHYHFAGEVRAIGDIRVDQLEQMVRCGFNAFHLADGQNSDRALEKLRGFSFSYQQTVDREPLFRKRA